MKSDLDQEQEWVPCWCGKPAAYTEFGEHGSPPILLCMEHKPQYEFKMVRDAIYGPGSTLHSPSPADEPETVHG